MQAEKELRELENLRKERERNEMMHLKKLKLQEKNIQKNMIKQE
jgi:hypothetical protein